MKYLISIILLMFSINGFAIQQRLIDATEAYAKVEDEIKSLQNKMAATKNGIAFWAKKLKEDQREHSLSYNIMDIHKKYLLEEETELKKIEVQIAETQVVLKKLEPLKKEYDEQIKKKYDRKEFINSTLYGLGTIGLPIVLIIWNIVSSVKTNRKYKKMLDEGKITQKQYDELTKCDEDFPKRHRINPATGLPMAGSGMCDVGGNAMGSSPSSSSGIDYLQDYRNRHRWD